MRVTMVAPFGLEPKGTTRWRVLPLARAVAPLGRRVTVIVPSWDWLRDGGRRWREGGVDVICLPMPPMRGLALSASLLVGVLRAAELSAPDVVHVFKPIGYSGLCGMWMRALGSVVCVDADDWEGRGGWSDASGRPAGQRWLIRAQERSVLRGAQHVTVASRALVDRVSELGVLWRRITYLPNTSSLARVDVVREDARAVVYTRFVEVSPVHLIRLWERITAMIPEATLCVIGAGLHSEERELARLAAEKSIHSIRVEGELTPEQLSQAMGCCSLAIFPCSDTLINRTKCSVRLVDLVALGLPVVAHSVGECSHLVRDRETGFLVEPGDDDGFVRAAVTLLRDPVLARRMGDSAKVHYAMSFSPDRIGATLAELYDSVIASEGRTVKNASGSTGARSDHPTGAV